MKTLADTAQDLGDITGSEREESGMGHEERKMSFPETRFNW